ncbi:hypothetical protein Slin15195_G012210 [Septoria linicola]|uniref:Uncharacterized protein n=1 Tax=Septoria linicola TaxID=215465 RepID=A0A9Q9AF63_9PEZI|nr:hypothetical protein Slin14017_G012230 [Septoria linicola]USW47902.1 hypothetical protein Slin15195_G012210 [Septoria linicola]
MMEQKSQKTPQSTGLNQDGRYPPSQKQRENEWSFLDLPGEVQNAIYLAVLSEKGAILTKALRITMPNNLGLVSKQIHAQMCGQAMYCVRVEVSNFNFSKVITFLNKLSEEDVGLLRPKGKTSRSCDEDVRQAKIIVSLHLENPDWLHVVPNLSRWLNRFNNADKRAADISFDYVVRFGALAAHYQVHRYLEKANLSIETEQKKQHVRMIRGAILQKWQSEYDTLSSLVQEMASSCNTTRVHRFQPYDCKHCELAADKSYYEPPEGYYLGTELVEVGGCRH